MPRGFGADSRFQSNPSDNAGFGSPRVVGSATVARGLGFASASPAWQPQNAWRAPLAPYYPLEFDHYPDDGGVIVRIFAAVWLQAGPWVVRLTADAGATMHPLTQVGCYSGVIGQAHLCYTDRFRRVLSFVLPPLPLGTYDIWVDDPALGLWGQTKITNQLKIVERNQAEEIYGARRTFPPRFRTGPRDWALEDATLPTLPTPPLETITRAVGQVIQQAGGSPQTRLLSKLSEGDTIAHVETTLGFAATGEIWIGPRRYSYTGIAEAPTTPRFTGLVLLTSSDGSILHALTEVTCHAAALLPG